MAAVGGWALLFGIALASLCFATVAALRDQEAVTLDSSSMRVSDAVVDDGLREAAALRKQTFQFSKLNRRLVLGWDTFVYNNQTHIELPDGSFKCENVEFKEPSYKVLNASGGSFRVSVLIRGHTKQEAVLKMSQNPLLDSTLEDECKILRKLENIEHIVRCKATCVQSSGARVIVLMPFLKNLEQVRGSVDKLSLGPKVQAARLTWAVAFKMLEMGIVHSNPDDNILYKSDGTPIFVGFSYAWDLMLTEMPAAYSVLTPEIKKKDLDLLYTKDFLEGVMRKSPLHWWFQRAHGETDCEAIDWLLRAPCPPRRSGEKWKAFLKELGHDVASAVQEELRNGIF